MEKITVMGEALLRLYTGQPLEQVEQFQVTCGGTGLETACTIVRLGGRCSLEHRKGRATSELGDLLFEADKRSRPCFRCEAEAECNWKSSQKNRKIKY